MKNIISKNLVIWLMATMLLLFLPIPLIPCLQGVTMMPPPPQRLIWCRGYIIEKKRYSMIDGVGLNWGVLFLATAGIALCITRALFIIRRKKTK